MSVLETDRLSELVQRKHACLVQLREAGRAQLELIRKGEMTALLDLLAAKQRLIIRLQQVERSLDPFRSQLPESRRWPTPADRDRCAAVLAQCESLLGDIVAQEKEGESELVRRRDVAADQLQGAHRSSQVRGAYTAALRSDGNQLDVWSGE
jgi:hypothetical protein